MWYKVKFGALISVMKVISNLIGETDGGKIYMDEERKKKTHTRARAHTHTRTHACKKTNTRQSNFNERRVKCLKLRGAGLFVLCNFEFDFGSSPFFVSPARHGEAQDMSRA
jgi:hypothetical protein